MIGVVEPGSSSIRDRVYAAAARHFLGPLAPLLDDPSVSEVIVNGHDRLYAERAGVIERVDASFADEHAVRALANTIAQFVGKSIDRERPILDGRLPDGSRVCVVLGDVTGGGTSINIRRFHPAAVEPRFLVERGAASESLVSMLLSSVAAHRTVLVAGGTGSGKTTVVNALSKAFGARERIVVIEDTRELRLANEHVVQLEARPPDASGRGRVNIRDLFVTSLRMRPDRIIVGEVRGPEAFDLVQAMTSGHRGTLATLHATSPSDACARLETMALLADTGLPLHAIRRQIASALDLIVQVERPASGRRVVARVSEVRYNDAQGEYEIADIFAPDRPDADATWTGLRPSFAPEVLAALPGSREGSDAEVWLGVRP